MFGIRREQRDARLKVLIDLGPCHTQRIGSAVSEYPASSNSTGEMELNRNAHVTVRV